MTALAILGFIGGSIGIFAFIAQQAQRRRARADAWVSAVEAALDASEVAVNASSAAIAAVGPCQCGFCRMDFVWLRNEPLTVANQIAAGMAQRTNRGASA